MCIVFGAQGVLFGALGKCLGLRAYEFGSRISGLVSRFVVCVSCLAIRGFRV